MLSTADNLGKLYSKSQMPDKAEKLYMRTLESGGIRKDHRSSVGVNV